MGTQGYGKMLKRIQILEDGRVPSKGGKKIVSKAFEQIQDGRFHVEKGSWNLARNKALQDRGVGYGKMEKVRQKEKYKWTRR